MSNRRPKKLYKVKLDCQMMVLAEDERQAREVAHQCLDHEIHQRPEGIRVVCQVKHPSNVASGWLDRIPWTCHFSRLLDGKTVREIIERKLFLPFSRNKKGRHDADHKPACPQG